MSEAYYEVAPLEPWQIVLAYSIRVLAIVWFLAAARRVWEGCPRLELSAHGCAAAVLACFQVTPLRSGMMMADAPEEIVGPIPLWVEPALFMVVASTLVIGVLVRVAQLAWPKDAPPNQQ